MSQQMPGDFWQSDWKRLAERPHTSWLATMKKDLYHTTTVNLSSPTQVVAGCGRQISTLASSREQTPVSVTEILRSLVHVSGTVCQRNCVSQTSNWKNFDGYWKRFRLRETPALSDYCFWAPYKYSAAATTTTTSVWKMPPSWHWTDTQTDK